MADSSSSRRPKNRGKAVADDQSPAVVFTDETPDETDPQDSTLEAGPSANPLPRRTRNVRDYDQAIQDLETRMESRMESQLQTLLQAVRNTQPAAPGPLPSPHDLESPSRNSRRSSRRSQSRSRSRPRGKPTSEPKDLTDGVEPTFRAWKILVLGQFSDDPRKYTSVETQLRYILSHTNGEAQKIVLSGFPDLTDDATAQPGDFLSTNDAFSALQDAFDNSAAEQQARMQFNQLYMGVTEDFSSFRSKFLTLARQARIDPQKHREELWIKAAPELKQSLLAVEQTLVTFSALSNRLQSTDLNRKELLAETRRRRGPRTPYTTSGTTSSATETPLRTGTARQYSAPPARASATPEQSVTKAFSPALPVKASGLCYNCNEPGHVSRECPKPRKTETTIFLLEEELARYRPVADTESSGEEEP